MLGELTPLEETRAYKELVAKGEAMGRQESREEGRQREERLILRLLQRRIGPVPQAQQTRIAALPIEQLEALGEALLDFADLADLNRWLAEHWGAASSAMASRSWTPASAPPAMPC